MPGRCRSHNSHWRGWRAPEGWLTCRSRQTSVRMVSITVSCFIALFGLLSAGLAQTQTPAAAPVLVVAAEKRPIARSAEFVGRIEAPNRVDVRARVTGYLDAA